MDGKETRVERSEQEKIEFLKVFLNDGYTLFENWYVTMGNIYWYEKIIFCNGTRILFQCPYGISPYSANSLEDFNRILKGLEKLCTFSGLSKFFKKIPEYGADDIPESLVYDNINEYRELKTDDDLMLFPNATKVPFDEQEIDKVKQFLTSTMITNRQHKTAKNKARRASKLGESNPDVPDSDIVMEDTISVNNMNVNIMEEKISNRLTKQSIQETMESGKLGSKYGVKSDDINDVISDSDIHKQIILLSHYWSDILIDSMCILTKEEASYSKNGSTQNKNKKKYIDKIKFVKR